MEGYDEEYFLERRRHGEYPWEYWKDLADHGWVGVMIPEEYGGEGMGITELMMVMEETIRNGAWPNSGGFVLTNVFGGITLVKHGTEEQKERWLPGMADGEVRWALGLTEPDAGLNTSNISTSAEREGDEYVINGQKIWLSGGAEADRITLLTRTTPRSEVENSSEGLTLFLVDPDDPNIEFDEIPTEILDAEPTYSTYIEDLRVHESQMVGQEGKGLYHVFDTLNTERIALATQGLATGYVALEKASDYANEREVFGVPIGSHQAVQHPLADAYAELEAAKVITQKAAWMYDNDKPSTEIGAVANTANLQAGKAAWNACEAAMTTFGGMSASEEIGIVKMWGDIRHLRSAPISEQMLRNFLAEKELGLPRSY